MKQKALISLALGALIAAAFACRQQEAAPEGATEPPQTATTSEIPGTTNPVDLNPVIAQSYIDNVRIGHDLGPDGVIAEDKTSDSYTAGQTVHLTMTVKDAPATAAVKVAWFGPNDTKVNEETMNIPVGATSLAFKSTDTSKWAKGDYRAEVWIGDEKVASKDFKISG